MGPPKTFTREAVMSCRRNRNSFFMGVILALMMTHSQAFAFWGGEKLNVQLPTPIDEGGIVPIIVEATGYSSDPITGMEIVVVSNPLPFQEALSLQLAEPQPGFVVSTRLRFASLGQAKVSILTKQASGKITEKTVDAGPVQKAVDFSNPATLDVVFQSSFKFPSNEIGQPHTWAQKNSRNGYFAIRGRLHHPMLPPSEGEPTGHFVNQIEILDGETKIAVIRTTPVITNDPFFQIDIPSAPASGAAQVRWIDTRGFSFIK